MPTYSITTTLPYVNADPHIGHALEMVQADMLARFHRLRGDDVVFNTGTDEHGQKIYQKALAAGKEPQAYCDEYAAKFDGLKAALNLSYTHFIRTTDAHHVAAAQEFWRRCDANGDIYKRQYAVKYCVGCELEKTASELDRAPFRVLPEPLLVHLAARRPDTPDALEGAAGMTPYLFHNYGQGLAEAIRRGLEAPPVGAPPEAPRSDWNGPTARRYEALRAWRKALALERGVEPVVILETDEAKAIADAPSKSEDPQTWLAALSDFKREAYGEDILRVLQSLPPSAPRPKRRRRRRSSAQG